VGSAAAVLLNVSFNVFRYGSVWNAVQWEKWRLVESTATHFSFFLGMWFSPNGGFFFFWPELAFFTILGCFGMFIHYKEKKRVDGRALPFLVMCAFQFFLTLGLSKWHAPFGWFCWGSRLHLPWLLPTAFLMLIVYADQTETFVRRYFGSPALRGFAGLLLGIFCLPHLFVALDYRIVADVFRATAGCPRAPGLDDMPYYYSCMHEYLWPISPTLLRSFSLISWDIRTVVVASLYLGACLFGFAALPVTKEPLHGEIA
jgi:hypothetical protein